MTNNPTDDSRPWSVFLIFLRLGLTSFGGPIAHLGYFRAEFVTRRRWLSERSYADLVALCQFLPGPASSPSRHSGRTVSGWIQRGAGCLGWLHAAVCHSLDPFCARHLQLWRLRLAGRVAWLKSGGCGRGRSSSMGAWRVTYARMGCESPSWQLLPASFYLCRPRGDRLA